MEIHEEVVVKAIKELKKSSVKSVISSEWSMEHGLLHYRGKIYIPNTDLRQKIVALFHDSKIAGHPRRWKTLEGNLQITGDQTGGHYSISSPRRWSDGENQSRLGTVSPTFH